MKPTEHQLKALEHIRQHGGKVCRYVGGFWMPPLEGPPRPGHAFWWIDIRTVRSMEKKGLLRRCHEHEEEWRDPREVILESWDLTTTS